MSGEVTVTGFGVRTAFGTGAEALRRGVFAGVPAFAPTTRFDTGPYRTPMAAAAPDGPDAVEDWALRHALARCGDEALDMAGLGPGTEAAVLLGVAGDHTSVTRYWRGAAGSLLVPGDPGGPGPGDPGDPGGGSGKGGDSGRGEPARVRSTGTAANRLADAGAHGRADTGGRPKAAADGAAGAAPGHRPGGEATPHTGGAAAKRVADAVPAYLTELLAGRLGLTGPRLTFTNACVASAAAIIHACRLISSGRIDVAVCAGGYLVEEETFGKFDSGRALSRDGMVRPFSADRSGLLLGDGVAAVVLESAEHARRRGARPLTTVVGWGAATDAHHIAQPHPEGAGLARAARQALRLAGDPDAAALGYVNAHGTGTKYNDGAETRGLRAVFPERAEAVPVSSTKSTTGHLLEAAGVVEFLITMLALTDGVLPPTAGFTRPDPECDLDCVPNRPRQADVRRALTVNAAFGGANTALVLERP
ncbi:beta-ketoacyl-[acyl-carrier-protein] synthase family protein [Streptomyces phyllanthi]|uniref:beta-ketoacyl-[acyl-carrier-protein] synthase family protein n=1 Tax=Streptomyces phyllanthi TaxID=1803180 RepID=UPI001D134802|nr:beta-ketoacyl-[acyl-carrier-protein] synthase family protein [Streptomyces phyllanthi]